MNTSLKMIGVAFEIHDSIANKLKAQQHPDDAGLKLEVLHNAVSPSLMDLFHYGLSHSGVLVGK